MAEPLLTPKEPIGVIEVGSSAIRMVIAEIGPKLSIRTLESLQKPIAFGKDVFNTGRLSHTSIRESIDILDNFQSVLESYGVRRVQAIATSAVREAANKDNFLDQVFVRTGIDVEVVEGAEENRLDLIAVESALQGRFDFDKKNCLIMEVGTGSTEIILTTKGEVSLTRTLLIGPLRLPDQAVAKTRSGNDLHRLSNAWISCRRRRIQPGIQSLGDQHFHFDGLDHALSFAVSVYEKKDEVLGNAHASKNLPTLRKTLSKTPPVEELTDKYGMPYSDAEALYASSLPIYADFLSETKAGKYSRSDGQHP